MTDPAFTFSIQDENFYPLTLTRSVLDLRVGVLTIREKWQRLAVSQGIDVNYLHDILQLNEEAEHFWLPSSNTVLKELTQRDPQTNGCIKVSRLWDIFPILSNILTDDIMWLGQEISSIPPPNHVQHFGQHPLYIHETSDIEPCTINTTEGPVLIDKGVKIMQGALLRGPIYIGKNAVIKMGATLYAGCSIGNNCIIGGEVKNSIFLENSNKAHHGYIGDSYIGAYCNLGAGTSCSNLKNTAGQIKAWNMHVEQFEWATEKLGIIMGDHVRTAIHTGFNSGTVIGPYSNIFELNGLSPKFIPSFSWGGASAIRYNLENLIRDVHRWEKMKGSSPSEESIEKIKNLYAKFK